MTFRRQKLMFSFLVRRGSVRTRTAIAVCTLVLGVADPLWANSPGTPCNSTGALGSGVGGCSKPPAAPPSGTGSGLSRTDFFSAPMRFKVRVTKANGKPEVRKEIAAWVAKKVFPHPTPPEDALLGSAVRTLALTRYPVGTRRIGPGLYSATVDRKTLNALASRLAQAVSSGRLSYRVNRAAVTGGTPDENRFVERNLPIPPGGVADAQKVS